MAGVRRRWPRVTGVSQTEVSRVLRAHRSAGDDQRQSPVRAGSRARRRHELRQRRGLRGAPGALTRESRRLLGGCRSRTGVDAAVGRGARGRLPARQVFRRRHQQPHAQPARSAPRAGRRQSAGPDLGGRGRTKPVLHLPHARRGREPLRERVQAARRTQRRCGRDLHAEPERGDDRGAGVLPDRRALQHRLLGVLRPVAPRSARILSAEGHRDR